MDTPRAEAPASNVWLIGGDRLRPTEGRDAAAPSRPGIGVTGVRAPTRLLALADQSMTPIFQRCSAPTAYWSAPIWPQRCR